MLESRTDYFILACDAPSFSAAAAQVPMSPQGFTKIIRNLERDLGVTLFETDEHGVRHPTRYGEELYKYAKNAQAERRMLESAFSRIDRESKTEIRVACAVGTPGFLGDGALAGYTGRDDDVVVTFSELPDAPCDELVKEGKYDVGITLQPVDSALATKPLYSCPLLIWVNRNDPLAEKQSLRAADLAQRDIATPGKDFRCYQNLTALFANEGIEEPHLVEYAEVFWIYQFVKEGKGVGFSLPHLATLDLFDHDDSVIALPLEGITWQVCFAWLQTRELSQPELDLYEHLRAICKRIARECSKPQPHEQE